MNWAEIYEQKLIRGAIALIWGDDVIFDWVYSKMSMPMKSCAKTLLCTSKITSTCWYNLLICTIVNRLDYNAGNLADR